MKETIKIKFVDMYKSFSSQPIEHNFEWRYMSRNWDLVLSDDPDILVYSCFGNEHLRYDCLRLFYTPENIRPNYNECDYAFSFDFPIDERNFRLPLYRRWAEYPLLLKNRDPKKIKSENRSFCCILISNPNASERLSFFNALSKYKQVDSGGKWGNNIGYQIAPGRENKLNWLRKYKFCITFENSTYPGYTTEKLMDALVTDTIPIYWGNPIASLDFNPKAFINCHDYTSFDAVVELVKEIDNNESLYLEYLTQPYLSENKETEFCKEENIQARYDAILSTRKHHISKSRKRIQRGLLVWLSIQKKILRVQKSISIIFKRIALMNRND